MKCTNHNICGPFHGRCSCSPGISLLSLKEGARKILFLHHIWFSFGRKRCSWGGHWGGKFCHVVSNFDIVATMLLAPFDSIVDHLNAITPQWGNNGIGAESVALTSLVEKVLPYTSDMTSPYRPFVTYMFCSTKGAACIDDSEAVLKMLHFTMQGTPLDQYVDACASYHTGYGKMLEAVTHALLNATPFANSATDPF